MAAAHAANATVSTGGAAHRRGQNKGGYCDCSGEAGNTAFWNWLPCRPCCNRAARLDLLETTSEAAETKEVSDDRVVPHEANKDVLAALTKAGITYRGQWSGAYFHGNGVLTSLAGTYAGQFQAGRVHGEGKFVSTDGSSYSGQWVADQAHGYGRYRSALDDPKGFTSFEGEWKHDEKCGHGVEDYSDNSKYHGEFFAGGKHGDGVYLNGNSDEIYRGEFFNDKMHGHGTFTFPDGRKYVGEWLEGRMSGKGDMLWKDGSRYVGEMRTDQRCGTGTLTWPSGRTYEGEWKDGKPHGKGTVSENGVKEEGIWECGVVVYPVLSEQQRLEARQHFRPAEVPPVAPTSPKPVANGVSKSSKSRQRSAP
eukprot:TRINITY_DN67190_c0_g1_i1.p1 TRINITY_DN67190_c0_g1~~TRINITY_DN67190_c0_g1_i1.p1  ORF type:complete len:365 (-),score=41.61 TRINITY_DN67190_c0_g1_i1:80-1174(-)